MVSFIGCLHDGRQVFCSTYPRRSERNGPLALPGHARSLFQSPSGCSRLRLAAHGNHEGAVLQRFHRVTYARSKGQQTPSAEHDSFVERVKTDRSLYDCNSDLSFGLMLVQCFTPRENGQNNAYVFVLGEYGRALSLVGLPLISFYLGNLFRNRECHHWLIKFVRIHSSTSPEEPLSGGSTPFSTHFWTGF